MVDEDEVTDEERRVVNDRAFGLLERLLLDSGPAGPHDFTGVVRSGPYTGMIVPGFTRRFEGEESRPYGFVGPMPDIYPGRPVGYIGPLPAYPGRPFIATTAVLRLVR